MRLASLAPLLALAGCGFPTQPEQSRAEEVVWRGTFAAPDAPPPIEWRQDECGGPLAGARYEGQCYAGLYLRGDRALVAWRGSFHQSAYAHELMHALQWSRGIEDPQHLRPEWTLVDAANRALDGDGL